jgi:hypothetical protein
VIWLLPFPLIYDIKKEYLYFLMAYYPDTPYAAIFLLKSMKRILKTLEKKQLSLVGIFFKLHEKWLPIVSLLLGMSTKI